MEKTVMYFEKPGKENSELCLKAVKNVVKDGNYAYLIVASTEGDTGLLFSEAFRNSGLHTIVVTHSAGFKTPNSHEMTVATKERIEKAGAQVYTGTMITHGIETAFTAKFNGLSPAIIVANALRRLGEGTKVGCEIVMMAADAGLIPEGEEVLAVAGTGRGADTVLVIRSAASKRFLDLKVLEVLAKPKG